MANRAGRCIAGDSWRERCAVSRWDVEVGARGSGRDNMAVVERPDHDDALVRQLALVPTLSLRQHHVLMLYFADMSDP